MQKEILEKKWVFILVGASAIIFAVSLFDGGFTAAVVGGNYNDPKPVLGVILLMTGLAVDHFFYK